MCVDKVRVRKITSVNVLNYSYWDARKYIHSFKSVKYKVKLWSL